MLDRVTGLTQHVTKVPGGDYRLHAPVVFKERIVYPTTTNLEIYDSNGIEVRTIPVHAAIRSDAVGDPGYVYVPTDVPGGGRLLKIEAVGRIDNPAWALQTYHGGIAGAPAFHSGVIYMASEDGQVYAVSSRRASRSGR